MMMLPIALAVILKLEEAAGAKEVRSLAIGLLLAGVGRHPEAIWVVGALAPRRLMTTQAAAEIALLALGGIETQGED